MFGGNGNDIFRGLAATADGGYVACGTTTSTQDDFAGRYGSDWQIPYAFVVKFDKNAQVEWIKTFGSSVSDIFLEDIDVLDDGSIVTVGYQHITDYTISETKGISEAVIYKLSATDGKILGQKVLGGSKNDIFNCVSATSSGFVAGGKTDSADGDFSGTPENSAIIINFDSDFNIVWQKNLSGSKGASIEDISADSNGNIFVSCLTSSTDGDFAAFEELMGGYIDTVILKYDSNGNYKWDFVIASSGRDEFTSVAADGSGGCIVGGQYELITSYIPDGTLADIHNCGGIDALVFRINSNGTEKWTKVLSGLNDDYITDISVSTKGYAISGYTKSGNREFSSIGNLGSYDGFVCFVNTSGTTVNLYSQAGTLEDASACVACSTNGKFLVAGKTESTDNNFKANTGGGFTGYVAVYSIQ